MLSSWGVVGQGFIGCKRVAKGLYRVIGLRWVGLCIIMFFAIFR